MRCGNPKKAGSQEVDSIQMIGGFILWDGEIRERAKRCQREEKGNCGLRIGSALSVPTASRFDALRLLKALSPSKGTSPITSAD
jgi:hypothetical protein